MKKLKDMLTPLGLTHNKAVRASKLKPVKVKSKITGKVSLANLLKGFSKGGI